jgi:glucose-1-phosphate thymidylyltransferase
MINQISKRIIGIIPAAGKGTRLSPFPCPKELFPIGYQDYPVNGLIQKRPKVISQYLIENIINAGASHILFILGEDKYDIMRYYSDGKRFNVDIAYLFQEKLSGMPFALNLAKNWINDDLVLFGMPDTIIEPRDVFEKLLAYHQKESSDLTLGLFLTNNPSKFGMVDLDSSGFVTSIVDKPQETSLKYMWGCACWSPSFSLLIDEYLKSHPYNGQEVVLGDIFLYAIQKEFTVKGLIFERGKYIDIGTVDELDSALKKFHL